MAVTKKSSTAASAKGKATKKGSRVSSSHPTWIDMIKECIVSHPEEARAGVSRPTIKKFVEDKYRIEVNASTASQLNRAISSGSEKGVFTLPKGPSGKVKLARHDAAKENATPAAKKPVVKAKLGGPKKTLTKTKGSTQAKVSAPKVAAKLPKTPSSRASKAVKTSAKKTVPSKKVAPSRKEATGVARKSSTAKKGSVKKVTAPAKVPAKIKGSKADAASKGKPTSKPKPASKTAKPKSSTRKGTAAAAA
jgi:hypothetical protein